ncbi:hypothetical protein N7475_008844, partial [Penicillium sp. IBT 31633x]
MEGLPKHWEESALQRSQLCQDVESIVDESAPQLLKALPTEPTPQLPSKNLQTETVNSTENSPVKSEASQTLSPKRKHRLLSQLASFNSLRRRGTNPAASPKKTGATNSPTKTSNKTPATTEDSPGKSPKKGSFHLPKFTSFRSLSLRHRDPIQASTLGIIEAQKPARRSILSPSTFVPPVSPDIIESQKPARRSILSPSTFVPPASPDIIEAQKPARDSILPSSTCVPSASTGLVKAQVSARHSVLSPLTFIPPASPLRSPFSVRAPSPLRDSSSPRAPFPVHITANVPIISPLPISPNAPRLAYSTLCRESSATKFDVAPSKSSSPEPKASSVKDKMKNYPYMHLQPTVPSDSTLDDSDWGFRRGSRPGTPSTPHPVHPSRISLMCYFNDGGSWDLISRKTSILRLNLFLDARRELSDEIPPSLVETTGESGTDQASVEELGVERVTPVSVNSESAVDEEPVTVSSHAGKATTTDFDNEKSGESVEVGSAASADNKAANDKPNTSDAGQQTAAEAKYEAALQQAIAHCEEIVDHGAADKPPVTDDDVYEITMLSLEQMRPLCEFRNLRVLKLTGMMRSYQPYIWETAWLNPKLVSLELGMAMSPTIVNPAGPSGWKTIEVGWEMNMAPCELPVYYGNTNGELAGTIGTGEYLDKHCIGKAKFAAHARGQLPVKVLTLSGFAVDGDAIALWFRNLEEVHFKTDCVDCGFWLSRAQRDVRVCHSDGEYVDVSRVEDTSSEE